MTTGPEFSDERSFLRRHRTGILFCAKGLFSALLLSAILWRLDIRQIYSHVREVRIGYLVVAIGMVFASLSLAAWRWKVISSGLIPFGAALKYTLIGTFYGAILPGAISGDVAKGTALAVKHRHTRVVTLPVSILLDRVIGMLVLLALFGLSCLLLATGYLSDAPAMKNMGALGFGLSLFVLVGAGLTATPVAQRFVGWGIGIVPFEKLRAFLDTAHIALYRIAQQPRTMLAAAALSLGAHGFNIGIYSLLTYSLGVPLDPMTATIFYSLLSVVVMVPISISGLGVRDLVALVFFRNLALDGEVGVAFSWLLLMVTLVVAAAGGLVQLREIFARPKGIEVPERAEE